MVNPNLTPTSPLPQPPRLPISFVPLNETQVVDFYREIDKENRGFVTIAQLSEILEHLVDELFHEPTWLQHSFDTQFRDSESGESNSRRARLHVFVQELFPGFNSNIPKNDFLAAVRSWNIPFPSKTNASEPRPFILRRLWARWKLETPRFAFLAAIVALQVAFGLWQMIKYIRAPTARSAFGWGVILSKAAAGAIYPTFFFLLLSMSRYFATLIRRIKYVPRILNWDRSETTHVWMAIAGLALATLHAIGYLAGSFVHGSKPSHEAAVQVIFGSRAAPRSYAQFMKQLPGWTGIAALGLYWIIAILSAPLIRSRSWELFQLGHVLMFPMLGLLCAHGTLAILQTPILGYWLAFPLFLVLLERSSRLAHGCRKVKARMTILDDHTVNVAFEHPRGNWWNYEAGQYIFLQVPSISFFQWHPFTISSCSGKLVQVHIQTGGNWTRSLRSLPTDRDIHIGVDGPFGAPSQRFYEFDRAVVLGAGVGITPFSAIMTDLEQKMASGLGPWVETKHAHESSTEQAGALDGDRLPTSPPDSARAGSRDVEQSRSRRRVDFHWIVRGREDLLWFSALLNRAHDLSLTLPTSTLVLNINTYITTGHKTLTAYVFRYLLDSYRPSPSSQSLLTGLKTRSQHGRPDLKDVLSEFHEDLKRTGWTGGRVGVFFCGRSHIGRALAEACTKLNATAQRDGSRMRYVFVMEAFG